MSARKLLAGVSAAALIVLQAASAKAATLEVINFDQFANAYATPMPNGYAGLNWSAYFYVVNTNAVPGTGYVTGMISSPNVAYNWGPVDTISMSAATQPFKLISGYFTAVWEASMPLTVTGSRNGVSVFVNTLTVLGATPSLFTFPNVVVDKVTFDKTNCGCSGQFAMDNFTVLLGPFMPNFASLALTQNQSAVGGALQAVASGANSAVLNALSNLDSVSGPATLDQLSGAGVGAAQNLGLQQNRYFTSAITDQALLWLQGGPDASGVTAGTPVAPLRYAETATFRSPIKVKDAPLPAPRTWRVWLTGFGGAGSWSGGLSQGIAGQSGNFYGGALGLDYQVLPNMLIGASLGLSEGRFSVGSLATTGSTSGVHIGAYSAVAFGAWYGIGELSFSTFRNSTRRIVGGLGGVTPETESGAYGSQAVRARFEIGRRFSFEGFGLTPFGAIELARLTANPFMESGWSAAGPALFQLSYAGQSAYSTLSSLGARIEHRFDLGGGMSLTPSLSVAWLHEFSTRRQVTAGLINLPGAGFTVDAARPARDAARVKAGAQLTLNRFASIYANFDGDFSGRSRFYGGKGGLKLAW